MTTFVFLRGAAICAAAILVTACASPGAGNPGQVVDRLPAQAKPAIPALPRLSQDDIVQLTKQGVSAESIISRIKESGTRHRLAASEIVALKSKGVSIVVLDYLLDSDRQALLDECSERINRLGREHMQTLQQQEMLCQQRCALSCPPWGPYPWRRWP
ncbi:MAG: hypothetical protein ACM3SV_13700 [Betaproteobacteria bacterium]